MIDASEYTSELMLLCIIILLVCVLGQAYMNWTARKARDKYYDSWQEAKWDLAKSHAEKNTLQAKMDELTEELAEARRILDGKGEGFVLIRRPRLVECNYEASMSGCRLGVFRFTVEDIDPGEDAERLTKILRSYKILIKGAGKNDRYKQRGIFQVSDTPKLARYGGLRIEDVRGGGDRRCHP